MPRWDCDDVLYRIFCITLLSIAVLSTIVLINVVIDIEGVTTINKVKTKTAKDLNYKQDEMEAVFIQDDDRNSPDKETLNYDDETNEYRTKRSLEIPHYLNKKSLTNRLATLLEELDDEEEAYNIKSKPDSHTPEIKKEPKLKEINKDVQINNEEERLHSTVHNLIIEELAKHSRLDDVYEKIHKIVENFPSADKRHTESKIKKTEVEDLTKTRKSIFSDEIIHCKTLHEDILKAAQKPKYDQIIKQGPRLIITTIIDILPARENIPQTEENVKQILKVIYKGANTNENNHDITSRVLSFTPQDDDIKNETVNVNNTQQTIPNEVMNRILEEYYNKNKEGKSKEHMKQKRMKRHVKIRYESDNKTTKKPKTKKKSSAQDDELFVEIETHFDSKGLKGEKKKKLIRELIDKIQKAIHNETIHEVEEKKKHKHLRVRKRIQNPLNHKSKAVLINKLSIPFQSINHREIDPISKSFPVSEQVPLVGDKSGENWRMKYTKPNFLSPSKGMNSAELALVDTDYNRVMEVNGIPQRLQKPINTDDSEEIPNTYFDLGRLKFFVKDIAGSGFSVGFNQYEDTAPDIETMKLFTGLENILQNYHQDYDFKNQPVPENFEGVIPDVAPSNIEHVVAKRSIEKDYHSNEYKLIFDPNYIPYSDYKEIFRKKVSNNEISKEKHTIVLNQNTFEKNLKPAKIFRLSELFREIRSSNKYHADSLEQKHSKKILKRFRAREKRSFKVKKITNLKNKIKLNRYLNTKPMYRTKIFMTKKRNKRQIGKIRIIASDSGHNPRHSEEDIFVVSDEKIFADRAIVRDINNVGSATPNMEPMVQEPIEFDKEINYDYNIAPYVYEEPPYHTTYSKIIRNNALMSKYPHILLEEIGRSKEYELPYSMMKVVDSPSHEHTIAPTEHNQAIINSISPAMEMPAKVSDIVNAIAPKSNYKLTVKISPKNTTDINSGYKETHTIINNSFNRDGLQYSSLVNVSEISKVIKLNKTTESSHVEGTSQSPIVMNMIESRKKMTYLLEQHKEKINAQLQHLNQEKKKLDSLLFNNETDFDAYAFQNLDYDIPTQGNIAEKNNIPNVRNSIHQTETTQQTTDAQQITKPTTQVDGFRLVNSIERNKNLTSEVLKKIDRNTDLLQSFFQKVISALDFTKGDTNKRTKIDLNQPNKESNTDTFFKHDMSNPKDINPVEFFSKSVPNLEVIKNNTHVSIPFVYAYQKHNNHKEPSSIIYHGHIHTNTIQSINKQDVKNKTVFNNVKREANQTKFFIDDLENDYKMVPLDNKRSIDGLGVRNGNDTI